MQQQDKTAQQHPKAVTEAINRRNSAALEASHWKTVVERTRDKYVRQYLEGRVELSSLRAVHYDLVAQSSMRPGRLPQIHTEPVTRTPVIRAKASLQIALCERDRSRAVTEREAHHAKGAAFTMLANQSRELGMESRARTYEARASLETASARGFDGVIRGYDKKLQDLGVQAKTREQPMSLQNSLDRLEGAQRNLEDYNNSHAQAMINLRRCRQIETDIETLEKDSVDYRLKLKGREKIEEAIYQRDTVSALAEREALAAARRYRDFRHGVQAAYKFYEALSLALTGRPPKTIRTALDNDGHAKAQTQGLVAAEEKPQGSGIAKSQESEPQTEQPETINIATSKQPHRNVAVGVVAGQLLRELERGM